MDKFEEAICGHNPLYKEGLQDKYYQGAKWAWQSRQAEVDQLNKTLSIKSKFLEDSDVTNKFLSEQLEEKDKRIEELESQIKGQIETLKCASKSWVYTEREQNIMISQADDLEKALRGEQ